MGRMIVVFGVICNFFFLMGCTKETPAVQEELRVVVEKEETQEKETEEIEVVEEAEEPEEELPLTVDVVDPMTDEIIHSFSPEEMGYGVNDDAYLEELKIWAKELARGTEEQEGYDQRMTPDKLEKNGEITKGSPRIILSEAELVERILQVSEKGGRVELPIEVTESEYAEEEVPYLDEAVVASYTTYFDSSVQGRSKNIELSAEAINNIILGVGDRFSFNTTVGPRTVETGYQKALEAVNGELVEGIGGGICQTSSTLFNAVDALNVDYIEKHHHSVAVGYVPHGRDATVSYGGLDFQFQNTTEVPLLIKTIIDGGSLTVEVRTSEANKAILLGEV